jgi:hypothetical protein
MSEQVETLLPEVILTAVEMPVTAGTPEMFKTLVAESASTAVGTAAIAET